jgi:hypothetical protein
MGIVIDAKKIDEKFGPPSYLETLLEDIGTKKGKIVEGLTNFLTLPYVKYTPLMPFFVIICTNANNQCFES